MARRALALFAVVGLLATPASARATEESPTAWGPTGLLHTPSAIANEAGELRGAVFVEAFTASGFLCTRAHPCAGATFDRLRHTGALSSFGATVLRGVDLYLTARAYVNESSQSSQLLEVLGETTLGARVSRPIRTGRFSVGGAAEAIVGSGPGDVGLSLSGTSVRLRALSSASFGSVRAHLALSYSFDNSGRLVSDVESSRGEEISRVERFGLGINRVDRLEPGLGIEWLGFGGGIRPFGEVGLALPINRQRYSCPARADGDDCPGSFGTLPSRLTLGARILPVMRVGEAVAVLAAVDLGLGGTRAFTSRFAPQAPWTAWLGVSMATSLGEWGPKIIVERVEVQVAPPRVSLRGFVHPAGKSTPIVHAIVRYVDDARPPLSTDDKGRFGDDVPPGSYELEIRAPGYRPNSCGGIAIVGKGSQSDLTLDCPLEEEPPPPAKTE